MSDGNAMIILLIVELIKKISFYKMSYFSEPYTHSKNKIKGQLDLPNYVTKSELKKRNGRRYIRFC